MKSQHTGLTSALYFTGRTRPVLLPDFCGVLLRQRCVFDTLRSGDQRKDDDGDYEGFRQIELWQRGVC